MVNKVDIEIKKLDSRAILPVYSTIGSAGADLFACIDKKVEIKPHTSAMIGTGVSLAIPETFVGLVFARSGLACKKGIAPRNKVGVIDSDYRGEIIVALYNQSEDSFTVNPGDRIAQIVFMPYYQANFALVDELSDTARGEDGFGSTGSK